MLLNKKDYLKNKITLIFIALIILLFIFIAIILNKQNNTTTGGISSSMYAQTGLEEKYWSAYSNCLDYIENQNWDKELKNAIELSKVRVETESSLKLNSYNFIHGTYTDLLKDTFFIMIIGEDDNDVFFICNKEDNKIIAVNYPFLDL